MNRTDGLAMLIREDYANILSKALKHYLKRITEVLDADEVELGETLLQKDVANITEQGEGALKILEHKSDIEFALLVKTYKVLPLRCTNRLCPRLEGSRR